MPLHGLVELVIRASDHDDIGRIPRSSRRAEGLYSWGAPPPPSFLHPDDLADLMIGSHSA